MSPYELMRKLEEASIHFSIGHIRSDAIMFNISVPGERWEIELFEDGNVEIECFKSNGDIVGARALNDLMDRFAEDK